MALLKRGWFVLFALFSAACSAGTPLGNYELGKQYQLVPQAQPPDDPSKVEVDEFFCYCCPHCFHVDPSVEEWRKHLAGDVVFVRVPNSLGRPDGQLLQKAFYIAQTLSVGDKLHKPLFEAIHVNHQQVATLDDVKNIFVAQGVKASDFDGVATSFVVDAGVRKADNLSQTYQISSVPSFVIGGKYVIVGAADDVLKIVDFLVDKVRKERKG